MTAARFWNLRDDVDGPWAARRRLADALRALNERCIRTEVSVEAFDAATSAVQAILATLPQGPTAHEAWLDKSYFEEPTRWIDRGALMGRSNPIAPPMRPVWDGTTSTCELVLSELYVGAPGMTHGGVVASIYDQMCGHAVVMSGSSGFTTNLAVRFRKPTPVHEPLRFVAFIEEKTLRQIRVRAECRRDGVLLTECEATFAALDPAKSAAVITGSQP